MARIAKKPITIPKGVEVKINGQIVTVKGPKGQIAYQVHDWFSVSLKDQTLIVSVKDVKDSEILKEQDKKLLESIWGTMRARLNNMIRGVITVFECKLLLVGVGYRAQMQGKQLSLSLGFSHPVNFNIPAGISIQLPSQTEIIISGVDRELVGQMAANIRAVRPVEPYKGKGVRYSDEVVVLKETKKK